MGSHGFRILYLCADNGIPLFGTKGASSHIRQFAEAMQDAGNEVILVTRGQARPDDPVTPYKTAFIPRTPGRTIPLGDTGTESDLSPTGAEFIQNTFVLDSILRLGSFEKYDLVYERYSLYSNAGLIFARAAGIPFILEVNAPLIEEATRYRRLDQPQLARTIEQELFSSADYIIAVSTEMKGYIEAILPGARITVVPNGVEMRRFERSMETDVVGKSPRSSDDRDITVGFVGNARPWHGITNLIDSIAILAREFPRCKLVIVGDTGNLRKDFETRCTQCGLDEVVSFTGPVPYEEIPSILKEIDIAVAPYPQLQNFYFSALKIFEYMAAGKAIVASRIGQISEILQHEKTALLVPPGDIDALSTALKRLLQDADLRRILGENARTEASNKHTWGQRIHDIMAVMDFLIASQKNELRRR